MTKDNNRLGTFDLMGIPPAPRGVPQIEVTFDMDANGILNVSAKEMGSGNAKNITIKNDKGRLSQAEIDRMVNEAEKYAAEDEKQKQKITARNSLEGYVFGVKQALESSGEKLSASEKEEAKRACDETIKWLDANQLADKDEYEDKMSSLSRICAPIMTKLHGGNGGQANASCGQQAGGFNANHNGPTVEEVD